jgi:hypothetical protein
MLYEQAPQLAYRYADFTIALQREGRPGAYTALLTEPDGRTATGTFTNPLSPTELSVAVASIRTGGNVLQRSVPEESLDPVRDMGARLYDALFHGSIGRAFMRALDSPEAGVRVRLLVTDDDAAGLPWEFLYDRRRDDFLVLSTRSPLVRRNGSREVAAATGSLLEPLDPPTRVLVAASDVTGTWQVGEELSALQAAAGESSNAELHIVDNATLTMVDDALATFRPHLVHLLATGIEEGRRGFGPVRQRLALLKEETAGSGPRPHVLIDGKHLAEVLARRDGLRAVVINGCNTDALAQTIAAVVPATVAHRGDINDHAAIAFAKGFYSALFNGLPLEAAVTGGRLEIDSRDPGGREWSAAVAYLQAPDGTFLRPRDDSQAATVAPVGAVPTSEVDAPATSDERAEQSLLLTIHQKNLGALIAQRERLSSPPSFLLQQIADTTSEIERLKGLDSGAPR